MDLKKEGYTNNINPDDLILILLYSNPKYIIPSKIIFVKQMFLMLKEIFPLKFDYFEYYPSNYGPFSEILMHKIDDLIEIGYVIKEEYLNMYGSKSYQYHLTKSGIDFSMQVFDKLSEKLKNKILVSKTIWDSLGYMGILRYVYSKYPEYTIKSKILDEVG